jgi:YaiO family outer membrane protein
MLALLLLALPVLADTPASRYDRARELAADGRSTEALAEFDALRRDFPGDVDYALGRAQMLARSGLAPDYEDVWRLRYSLLLRQPQAANAAERMAVQQAAAARFPESTWWQAEPVEAPGKWTMTVGAGYDSLSNGLPSWNNQFAELLYSLDAGRSLLARLARDERALAADLTLALGAEFNRQGGWFAGGDVLVADDPFYQPESGFSVHAGRALDDGWVVDLRYRRKEYANATIGSLVGTVEKYYGDFRFAYGYTWSRLQGASNFGNHLASTQWYYRDGASVGITLSDGKEAEAIGNGRVLETDVRSISLTGRREFDERLTLHWWLGLHDQGDLYRRQFLGMAVSIRI